MKLFRVFVYSKKDYKPLSDALMWAEDMEEAKAAIESDNDKYMQENFMYRIDPVLTAKEWREHTEMNSVVINQELIGG